MLGHYHRSTEATIQDSFNGEFGFSVIIKTMNFQAVIFDWDDTLIDSFPARVDALQNVFSSAGISQPSAETFFLAFRGVELREALKQHPATKDSALEMFESYRREYWTKEKGLIKLYPGVKEMLEELHAHGLKLAIVTQKGRQFEVDGCPAGASLELEEVGVQDLFPVIIGLEDVSWTKPHPQGIHKALAPLAISPEKTLVVGDSPADIEAAHNAGCRSCYATWGIPPENRLPNIRADFVVNDPILLSALIL